MVQSFENQRNSINLIENKYYYFFFSKYATYIFGHQEKGHEYYQFKKCPTHTIMKILQPQIAPGNQNIESNPLVILQNCLMYSREKEDST
jgi:hypothetical protein